MSRAALVAMMACILAGGAADAYRVNLVPANLKNDKGGLAGVVTITDADGKVRVSVSGLTDAAGAPIDSDRVMVQLRLHVNGRRRRVQLPLKTQLGAGSGTWSLGLTEGAAVIVNDLRLLTPNGKTAARAGVVTAPLLSAPPPGAPPPPVNCGEDFELCQIDLTFCEEELDLCEDSLPLPLVTSADGACSARP
jgi:hypothetical protein